MDTILIDHEGKWYSSKNAKYDAHGNVVAKHRYKRYRATVVIINNGRVLLVKDKGVKDYSFPGGGFKKGETTIQAGIREVCEELGGLTVLSAERLRQCDLHGTRAKHKVVLLTTSGKPYVKDKYELENDILWWDMKSKINVQGHVKYIIGKLAKTVTRDIQ